MKYENGIFGGTILKGKSKELGEKILPVPLFPLQISSGIMWH
jgi:hypothetical protein